MSIPLLVEWYRELPAIRDGFDDPDLASHRMQEARMAYEARIRGRYNAGTLERLLAADAVETRRAAVVALGLTGTSATTAVLARVLHDPDEVTARLAADALWAIWYRGDTPEQAEALAHATHLLEPGQILHQLDLIIREHPTFSEAFNQRAILYFQLGEFGKAIEDCDLVLSLNPHHFGAQAGKGQCLMRLNRPRAALTAFRQALEIHPRLDQVREMVKQLEEKIEEG